MTRWDMLDRKKRARTHAPGDEDLAVIWHPDIAAGSVPRRRAKRAIASVTKGNLSNLATPLFTDKN